MAATEQQRNFWKTLLPRKLTDDIIEEIRESVNALYGTRLSNFRITNPQLYVDVIEYTNFLPVDCSLTQRFWHIHKNNFKIPQCEQCNVVNVKWHASKKGYVQYCSVKCSAPNALYIRQNTCLEKYGCKSFSSTSSYKNLMTTDEMHQRCHGPEVTKKRHDTNLEKYGNVNALCSPEVRRKIINTNVSKYGTENVRKSPVIINKIKQTIKNRYGVESFNFTKDFKYTMDQYHNDSDAIATSVRKQQKTMQQKYGVASYFLRKMSDEDLRNLDDVDWLKSQHHDQKKSISLIAEMLGVDKQTVLLRFHCNNIQVIRHPHSSAEVEIGDILKNKGLDVITNDRTLLKPKELDIVIPANKLAIEYCGLYWHSDKHDRITSRTHLNKLKACNKVGYQLLTIFEDEWINNRDQCIAAILHKCGISKEQTVFARKTTIHVSSQKQKVEFFNANHIQGTGPGSLTYYLSCGNRIVAMITFIKKANGVWILNRYATSCNVPGGFSKLLSHFKKNNDWKVIESFADLRWSDGGIYKNNGFKLTKQLPPDYRYIIQGVRCHKFAFRHSSLKTKLSNYDPSLSEVENMKAHGYYRVWDCGLHKYIITNN